MFLSLMIFIAVAEENLVAPEQPDLVGEEIPNKSITCLHN